MNKKWSSEIFGVEMEISS